MFGLRTRKKVNNTIMQLDRFLDLLDECILVFKSGVKNYLEGNPEEFGDNLNGTSCEMGNVYINGALVRTINSESTEIEDIKKTIADCGLEGVENINDLQAIKKVIGITNQPLAN
ncbi:MAG: hypothetical protein SOV40_03905 [Prevotella sp.]|nr:hypothetical protein [Prevotella sp.]